MILLMMRQHICFHTYTEHVASKTRLIGEFVDVDGERHWRLTGVDLSMEMDNMRVSATGIFPEPALSKAIISNDSFASL